MTQTAGQGDDMHWQEDFVIMWKSSEELLGWLRSPRDKKEQQVTKQIEKLFKISRLSISTMYIVGNIRIKPSINNKGLVS